VLAKVRAILHAAVLSRRLLLAAAVASASRGIFLGRVTRSSFIKRFKKKKRKRKKENKIFSSY
jgi:hypothetical protein